MEESDCLTIHRENLAQGYHSDLSVYRSYFLKQNRGEILAFAAVYCGSLAGYVLLRPQAEEGPFAHRGIPELADFNVFQKYRRRGIGGKLLGTAENAAKQFGAAVSLGVGLHAGYGTAQRMYGKRGYLPDGSGVWHQGRPLEPYAACFNDDSLILYLSKPL